MILIWWKICFAKILFLAVRFSQMVSMPQLHSWYVQSFVGITLLTFGLEQDENCIKVNSVEKKLVKS